MTVSVPDPCAIAPVVLRDFFPDVDDITDKLAACGPFPAITSGRKERLTAAQAEVFTRRAAGADRDGLQPVYRLDFPPGPSSASPILAVLGSDRFRQAVSTAFGGAFIGHPLESAINAFPPLGGGLAAHTDVPFFLGLEEGPRWLRLLMMRSGLFEAWRWPLASGLFWLHRGAGGAFEYWDRGPAAPSRVLSDLHNSGLIADNDFMFHRVVPVEGGGDDGLSADQLKATRLWRDPDDRDRWLLGGEAVLRRFAAREMRFTILVKAPVFADAGAAAAFAHPDRRLDPTLVMEIFLNDLAARGVRVAAGASGAPDLEAVVRQISLTYPAPTLGAPAEEHHQECMN